MDKASLTLRHITAWQTEHVSLSCLSRIRPGLNHVRPHSSSKLCQALAISRVYLASVHPPVVPTLKMAVWLRSPRRRTIIPGESPMRTDRFRSFRTRRQSLNYCHSCFHKTTKHSCVTVTEKTGTSSVSGG